MAPRHSSDAGAGSGSAVPLGDSSATSDIVAQARNRSDGFDIGGDRAIVSTPNWNNQESEQLYRGATQNNDPGTAEATGHVWTSHAQELSQASNDLYTAISELGAVWIGQGAAAAQGALVGIANSSSQASEAAHTMASRMAQQAAAAAEVKKMPAPKNYDPASAMTAALAGGPAAMIADQKVQADAAADVKAQQVAFFNAYTKSMSDVDGSTPSFGPESLGMKPMTGNGGSSKFNQVGGFTPAGGMSGLGHGGSEGGFNTTGPVFGEHGSGAAAREFGSGSFAGSGLGPDSGHFSQAGFTPAAGPGAAGGVPASAPGVGSGAFSASSASASAAAAMTAGPSAGGGVGQALGLGALGGGLGIAGGRALSRGNRSGGKADDDSTAAAANENSAQSAASVGPHQQGLVSAGGTIGGSPTPPPMGAMGGAGGAHRQQDEEHTHASFLIDPDPDETFGANQATPPPVIGAWSEED
jgi:hypothetical protein